MTTDSRNDAVEQYRARRGELMRQASTAAATGRPTLAAELRQAARELSRAIEDELINRVPEGLAR